MQWQISSPQECIERLGQAPIVSTDETVQQLEQAVRRVHTMDQQCWARSGRQNEDP